MAEQPRLNGSGAGVARSVPLGDDWIARRLREQDERIMQNLAAMRVMVGPLAQAVAAAQQAIDDVAAAQVTLTAQQVTLTAQQATLTAQQATLTAQQATLTAQQATLTDLVAKVVLPGSFTASASGFDPVAGAWATVSSVTLTVPTGFTQAVVTAIAYAGITSAGGDIHCRARVAGAGGPADTRSTSPGQWRPVLSMFSRLVTGLTAGGTVAVDCQAYVATDVGADAANTATINGTVLWLR